MRAEEICLPRAVGGYSVDHVSLSVRGGEILGVYGLMGAGRTEFLECVMGRHPLSSGRLYIEGKLVRERDVGGRIARGLALIPEDRQRDGLVAILSVAENLTMASLRKLTWFFHIQSRLEAEVVRREVKNLTIKVADPALPVSSLSGGNQQKVVIGKALLTEPKVLLMDEPSRGIDIGAKADVFRSDAQARRRGTWNRFRDFRSRRSFGALRSHCGDEPGEAHGLVRSRRRRRSQDHRRVFRRPLPGRDDGAGGNAFMTAAAGQTPAQAVGGSFTLNLMRVRTFIALFAVLIFFSFTAPNFLSAANLVLMSKHVALNAFLAIGMTFVIITGGIDLSVGSIVGLCGMVAGGLILHGIDLSLRLHVVLQHSGDHPDHAGAGRARSAWSMASSSPGSTSRLSSRRSARSMWRVARRF